MSYPLSFALAALLAAPASTAPAPVPANPPGEVVGWLQPLAGQSAVACDTLACAASALEQSKAFWIALDTHATPAAWTGIARNSEGKAWSVSFGPHSVTVLSCSSIRVEATGLRCVG